MAGTLNNVQCQRYLSQVNLIIIIRQLFRNKKTAKGKKYIYNYIAYCNDKSQHKGHMLRLNTLFAQYSDVPLICEFFIIQ